MNRQNIAAHIQTDPRDRSESDWLNTLEFLVAQLAEATSSHLHIGTYWCSDEPGDSSASIVARVRSHSPLPGIDSDYWEGALCYSGSEKGAYADAFVFPFLKRSRLVSHGTVDANAEVDEEFRLIQFDGSMFIDRGWSYADASGEWGWVKKPGDEYWQSVRAKTVSTEIISGAPILVDLSNIIVPNAHRPRQQSSARVSLIHANRGRENTNLCPWGERLPRENSPHAIPIGQLKVHGSGLQFDLAQFGIRGGWTPGKYHVAVRVQNCRKQDDWSYSSDISAPFKFTVLGNSHIAIE